MSSGAANNELGAAAAAVAAAARLVRLSLPVATLYQFDLEMSNAAPVDFPEVLSDAESVVQLKAASGEGCATPEKSTEGWFCCTLE
ncbi:hypothetical protein EJB05_46047 [Eragrostis curvula]|uniref:Uncharacterized protein n=1 Tax=Eragrostis curvula TaxID=38414 RepID=A0A5J9TM57_9POAL|nr:hypothetical protein EJB05_46047 [Eragrostis curvula]